MANNIRVILIKGEPSGHELTIDGLSDSFTFREFNNFGGTLNGSEGQDHANLQSIDRILRHGMESVEHDSVIQTFSRAAKNGTEDFAFALNKVVPRNMDVEFFVSALSQTNDYFKTAMTQTIATLTRVDEGVQDIKGMVGTVMSGQDKNKTVLDDMRDELTQLRKMISKITVASTEPEFEKPDVPAPITEVQAETPSEHQTHYHFTMGPNTSKLVANDFSGYHNVVGNLYRHEGYSTTPVFGPSGEKITFMRRVQSTTGPLSTQNGFIGRYLGELFLQKGEVGCKIELGIMVYNGSTLIAGRGSAQALSIYNPYFLDKRGIHIGALAKSASLGETFPLHRDGIRGVEKCLIGGGSDDLIEMLMNISYLEANKVFTTIPYPAKDTEFGDALVDFLFNNETSFKTRGFQSDNFIPTDLSKVLLRGTDMNLWSVALSTVCEAFMEARTTARRESKESMTFRIGNAHSGTRIEEHVSALLNWSLRAVDSQPLMGLKQVCRSSMTEKKVNNANYGMIRVATDGDKKYYYCAECGLGYKTIAERHVCSTLDISHGKCYLQQFSSSIGFIETIYVRDDFQLSTVMTKQELAEGRWDITRHSLRNRQGAMIATGSLAEWNTMVETQARIRNSQRKQHIGYGRRF